MTSLAAVLAFVVVSAGSVVGPTGSLDDLSQVEDSPAALSSSTTLHTLASVEEFKVASADGTVLRGHVYLPDGKEPFATVLEYSPYWNTQNGGSGSMAVKTEDGRTSLGQWLGPYLDAGFAVALFNARGFGISEGCADFGGIKESQDIRATIDALAEQPWSNGNIGMIGLSYPGWMQYVALRDPSPHLKTIIPVSGIIDYYGLTQRNGAVITLGPVLSGALATLSLTPGATQVANHGELGETRPSHFACTTIPVAESEDLKRAAIGDRNAYWDERDYRSFIPNFDGPILVTNGMKDGEDHILQVDDLWPLLPAGSRMLIGQWPHGFPGGEFMTPDPSYTGPKYSELAVAWMDQHLRGGPTVPTGFVEYEDDARQWHTAPSWPPPASPAVLQLTATGLVADEEAVPAGTQTFLSSDFVPAPSPCPDRAVFVSPPLADDVLLAGYFTANLTLGSTLPDGNLVVSLFHGQLDPTTCTLELGKEVRHANTDLRHRGHLAVGVPFPMTETDQVDVRSYLFATPVPAGERLILTVAGGSQELFPDVKPQVTVHAGEGDAGSSITLNVVEGTLSFA